jgi:ABC-type multidrug transport system fused ATPase/permease subunit
MMLASLDLLGILLLGLVAAIATTMVTGDAPSFLIDILSRFGLSETNELELTIVLAIVAGITFISKSVLSFILVRKSYRFLANRQAIISSRLAARLLSRPLLEVLGKPSQETAYALTIGVNSATLGVLGGAVVVAAEVAVLIVVAVGLMAIDPFVAILTVVYFAFIGVILSRILGARARRLGTVSSQAEIESYRAVQDAIRTYREVSVSGRRGITVTQFQDLRWRAAQVQAEMQIMSQISKYIFEISLVIGAGALAFSQALTRDVSVAVTVMAIFLAAASRTMPALLRLQQASLNIRNAAGVAAPTFELNEQPWIGEYDPTTASQSRFQIMEGIRFGHPDFEPSIELKNIVMSYPGADSPALFNISLTAKTGESLALVGPTGAGKSTLADVILGVLVPDEGSVTIGGISPGQVAATWPGAVAYVPQETSVLEGTIRQNVGLALPTDALDDEQIWEALERAHLAAFLREQRDGLDTVVGEHGVKLSGGQRQRLGLARALYSRPKLLVMDEATSALDSTTEQAVSEAIQELEGEVTLVVVAHRLATIRNCSQVAYIEGGVIRSIGSFDSVRKSEPNFDHQATILGL